MIATRKSISHVLFAFLLALSTGACDSSDPAADSDDDPNGDPDDGEYSCTVPSVDDLSVGEAAVAYDYADVNGDGDITDSYTGDAVYGTVTEFSDDWSVLYLPQNDGQTRNVTIYNEAEYTGDGALEEGSFLVSAASPQAFRGYLWFDRGNISERNGGNGLLIVSSIADGVATGTFEFGDSFSAFCGAFRAKLSDGLDPAGFDPF